MPLFSPWQLLCVLCSSLSSLSTCAFSSSSSLWNWLCTSPLCWCCSDRKTHPPPAALSPPLLASHWLPVRGDITLLLCLPASVLLCSLPRSLFTSISVDPGHSFIVTPSPASSPPYCPLSVPPPPSVLFFLPVRTVWIYRSSCCYYCAYMQCQAY